MQPDNPKLWNTLKQQAVAKYPRQHGKGTTPQANKWISEQYAQAGGGFVRSKKEIDPKKRDLKQEAKNRVEERKKRQKKNLKQKGFVA